uniref:DNA repair protein RadC n=1 Tax=Candidatus Kentrum sp. FM TaxID=2126340 RepID=A0A450W8A0_9GAMM|nr:MAG: DNA repair protein RadC [Candidatus Kentron sp. FM]VFJ62503.1 MAG: DNA repair protein RadC [Candidatus Kentron sp. FM]VFK13282.1 MAG: DNA repair protein RadC [Candidatus Kentron sp. FM]
MGDHKTAVLETTTATTTTTTRLEIHNPPPPHSTHITLTQDQKIPIDKPADLASIMQAILRREDAEARRKEHLWVVGLRRDRRILYIELVSLGSTIETLVDPIEVYQSAVFNKAHSIALVHNHVDGTLRPSGADMEITNALIEGGKLLRIYVWDHLIISEKEYCSFLDEGVIEGVRPE